MKKLPVSVLMTVFNHENYIKFSIKSILSQSFKNFELIIIDNGSTDKSLEIINEIKDKRIRLYKFKKNIGRTKCLNFGLKKCRGKYIAIQDSDDISKKNRIKTLYTFLEKNLNIALVASNYNVINTKNKIIEKRICNIDLFSYPKNLFFNNPIGHSTIMYRYKIIKRIGTYPEKIIYAQDYAFYLKVIKHYKIILLKKILANLRVNHKKSESFRLRNSLLIQKEQMQIILWIVKNFKLSTIEKIKIFFRLIILLLKVIRSIIK